MQDNNKFPSAKIPRFISGGLVEIQVGAKVNNGAVYKLEGCLLDLDLHTTTNKFAPNEYREVVNLSGLVVYKGSNARVER